MDLRTGRGIYDGRTSWFHKVFIRILGPDDEFRHTWDFFILLLIAWSAVVDPYQWAFVSAAQDGSGWRIMEVCVSIAFGLVRFTCQHTDKA